MTTIPKHERRAFRSIEFTAEISMTEAEVEAGHGSLAQAVQNVVGHTGAIVLAVEDVTPTN